MDGPACYWRATDTNHSDTWVRVEQISTNTYELGKITGRTTPVPGIGDEAYLDKNHALYLRVGTTNLYIEVVKPDGTDNPAAERPVGSEVAGRL